MEVFLVQYQYATWGKASWKFVGIFSTELLAREWVEGQIEFAVWRNAHVGETVGFHAEGVAKEDGPTRFNVKPVEVDYLYKVKF